MITFSRKNARNMHTLCLSFEEQGYFIFSEWDILIAKIYNNKPISRTSIQHIFLLKWPFEGL